MDEATRNAVWIAMAEHYLDTETRPAMPFTALTCVEAGLSVEAARRIWRDEVEAVLGVNLLSVAGEWAGWEEAWLIEKLKARRAFNTRAWGLMRFVRFVELNLTAWASIERSMNALLSVAPEERAALSRELSRKAESEPS
jgi:hypothetical protein